VQPVLARFWFFSANKQEHRENFICSRRQTGFLFSVVVVAAKNADFLFCDVFNCD